MQADASRLMDELVSPIKVNLAMKIPQETPPGEM